MRRVSNLFGILCGLSSKKFFVERWDQKEKAGIWLSSTCRRCVWHLIEHRSWAKVGHCFVNSGPSGMMCCASIFFIVSKKGIFEKEKEETKPQRHVSIGLWSGKDLCLQFSLQRQCVAQGMAGLGQQPTGCAVANQLVLYEKSFKPPKNKLGSNYSQPKSGCPIWECCN